jgi:pimeloyl-ACP methyl ester carboxylesterase
VTPPATTPPAAESLADFVSIADRHAELIPVSGHDGLRLHLYRLRASRSGGPVILVGHACGFAAGSYLPLLQVLSKDADVYAFDARGHGGSEAPLPHGAGCSPADYARDLVRLAATVAERTGKPIHYVGHSLNAAAMLHLGACLPDLLRSLRWAGLLLFEPPIFPSPERPERAECAEKDTRLVQRTGQRRDRFSSPDELVALLTGRGLFRDLSHEYLVAHAHATLKPVETGYTLACPPAVEAATFAAFGDDTTFRALASFPEEIPVHLVGGDPDKGPERNWTTLMAPVLAEKLGAPSPRRRFTKLRGLGHLMVQEDPDTTLRLIRGLLQDFDFPPQESVHR